MKVPWRISVWKTSWTISSLRLRSKSASIPCTISSQPKTRKTGGERKNKIDEALRGFSSQSLDPNKKNQEYTKVYRYSGAKMESRAQLNYKIVKTKYKNFKKYGLIYETILCELENGLNISELYCHQKKILDRILIESNKKLYALVCCCYDKAYGTFSEEYKLWKGFVPVECEEFNTIEHAEFKMPIFEQEIKGELCTLWNGIAEITSSFYVNNYIFFNYQPLRLLLISDEKQVQQIKLRLNEYLNEIANRECLGDTYNKYCLSILKDTDCILVEAQDDAHEGIFMFYVNAKSKYNELLQKIFENNELKQ